MKKLFVCPTNYCNFSCVFCGSKKSIKKKNISVSKVEKILKKAKENNFKYLFLSGGGEPLLAINRVLKIIELSKRNGFAEIEVNTNGSCFCMPNHEKTIARLKEAGLTRIIFSIDTGHLKFISYRSIIQAIRTALKNGIKVRLKIVSLKKTIRKNEILIRKIVKELGGVKIEIPISNVKIFLVFIPSNLLIFHHFNAMKTDATPSHLIKGIDAYPLKRLIFNSCRSKTVTVNAYSKILPCCNFYALNNPELYMSNVDKSDNLFKKHNPILEDILKSRLAFAKIYLRITKNDDLKKDLLKEKFYSLCDFCFWIQKNRKEIQNIKVPSNFELLLFYISNFYALLTETVFVNLEKIMLLFIFNFSGLYYRIKNF